MKNFVTPPLIGSEFINLIKLFQKNKIDRSHIIKALYVASISLLGAPFRAYDKTKLSPEILGRDIKHPPIFIIGHWRSGTTYLHHLMSLDDNLAEMTSFQAFFPGNFLSSEKVWKSIVTPLWISQRPMDNVVYSPNVPEEEEYALGNISNYSFYHGFFFPKNMLDYFNKYVLFEDLGEKEVLKYKIKYMEIVKKLDLYYEQKQLIFKNPTNTARIKILLELFPQAKFIHIYRNPYIVYASIKNFYNKILPSFSF
ncbi:MAG: sulfotransferase, partial [Cyanobacteria bacterium J06558_2]